MRLNKILSVLPVATFLVVAALPAQAQGGFGFGFSKFGKKSAISVGVHSGPIAQPLSIRRPIHHSPGRFVTRCVEVWVPGCSKTVYIEPVYDTVVLPCGTVTRVLIREGYFKVIREPGHFETRCTEVWVPGVIYR